MAAGQRGVGARGRGREKGVPNKFTSAIKTAFELAFKQMQEHIPARGEEDFRLTAWAKKHPTEFYKLMARMVPQELSGPGGGAIPLGLSGQVLLYLPDNQRSNMGAPIIKLPPRGARR